MTGRAYAVDNDSERAADLHDALAALLDPVTRWRIGELLDLPDARCLEVAAGGGSIATWLARQVGPYGHVTATDTRPGLIPAHCRLTVLEHDITSPVPPGGNYDLVHARLLLNHLPQRRQVLQRLAEAVKPGGVLLTEDFWPTPPNEFVVCASSAEDATLIRRYQLAHLQVLAEHGSDRSWSRRAVIPFMEEGLADVRTVVSGGSWRGGGAGCRLLVAGIGQLYDELLVAGLTAEELDRLPTILQDPAVVLHGHLLYSTSGRRPAETDR